VVSSVGDLVCRRALTSFVLFHTPKITTHHELCITNIIKYIFIFDCSLGLLSVYRYPFQTTLLCPHSKWLQLVQVMGLHLPLVSLVPSGEVGCSFRVALHGPQHPVEDGLAESAAIGIAQSTAMPNGNVALPRRNTSCKVLEVALSLDEDLAFRLLSLMIAQKEEDSHWRKQYHHFHQAQTTPASSSLWPQSGSTTAQS
jgi:hypothetical protein